MEQVGVLGSGSWGTALAVHLASNGHHVTLWSRRPEFAGELAQGRENRRYLPGVRLPDNLESTADLGAMNRCRTVLVVVPSHGFREVLRQFFARRGELPVTVVSATKGIETESLARMSEVTAEEAQAAGVEARFAILSGPTFAEELARGMPSAAVVAAEDLELATELREMGAAPTLRLYSSVDVVGVELGGAAKNVVAVGAGVLHGMGLGHNTMAALITRGLHEMTRLCVKCGGELQTLSGLAGLGRPGVDLHRRAVSEPACRDRVGQGGRRWSRSNRARQWSPRGFATLWR